MTKCSSCTNNYDDSFMFCPRCGTPKPEPVAPPPTMPVNPNACPKCAMMDKVEKVSEIRRAQIVDTEGTMPVSRTYSDNNGNVHSYTGYRGFSSTQTTRLADALCPPAYPQNPRKHTAGTWWALAGLLDPCLPMPFMAFHPSFEASIVIKIALFGIGMTLWFMLFGKWKRRWNRELKQYKQMMENMPGEIRAYEIAKRNWDQLYYCYRDGCVYIPGTSTSAPVEDMLNYVHNPRNY